MREEADRIIIGGGLYGLYAAQRCKALGERVLVLEKEDAVFKRATTINQARLHMGYHYPRSLSTAMRSAGYFERFVREFASCVVDDFTQIYATSAVWSWSDAARFTKFCRDAGIPCTPTAPEPYFREGLVDGAFVTREYAYDAGLLGRRFLGELEDAPNVCIRMGACVCGIEHTSRGYRITDTDGNTYTAPFVLNATYAGVNEILQLAGFRPFPIKYELCEIILVETSDALRTLGVTVMDGPFFSVMPYGRTGMHSLTAVSFTPHASSAGILPHFPCQRGTQCTPDNLLNCDLCRNRPRTAWPYMSGMCRKYLKEDLRVGYVRSLFSMKPVLQASEVDDSRPTVVRADGEDGRFVSVLSGKINTVFDLDDVLDRQIPRQ